MSAHIARLSLALTPIHSTIMPKSKAALLYSSIRFDRVMQQKGSCPHPNCDTMDFLAVVRAVGLCHTDVILQATERSYRARYDTSHGFRHRADAILNHVGFDASTVLFCLHLAH
ncbi:hypothetical protein BCV70DRAFT_109896 [Testicularia cyperi]|uniref:Uncharacterized protein n=1 Tax=Testicularia cyperi TaxID=1882483 RepID=A0A317XMP6_9BASI|nr:hypothetical protein BCV70DRAFT_109896 [Testicularia cyperi]